MKPLSTLSVPTVHLNGTSYDGLFIPICDAASEIRKSIRALEECAPHGRDYYLQGDMVLAMATHEHLARISKLRSVLEELQSLAEQITDQRDSKARIP